MDEDLKGTFYMAGSVFFSARKFHQFDSSNNEFCGLRLMVRVEVSGSVNPNPNRIYNHNPNPN